jgi:choline dehydrogenase-like flavoprotein
LAHLKGIMCDLPYIGRAALWRYYHKQLLWPQPAEYELHVVTEQLPHPDNRISLSDERDVLGTPLPAINWQPRDSELVTLRAYMRRFDSFWKRQGLTRIGDIDWRHDPAELSVSHLPEGSDVYHPGGTTRMGHKAEEAVVDPDLKVFQVANLAIASTSVFPSGGSANPTLTLMALTARLADKLVRNVAKARLVTPQ